MRIRDKETGRTGVIAAMIGHSPANYWIQWDDGDSDWLGSDESFELI